MFEVGYSLSIYSDILGSVTGLSHMERKRLGMTIGLTKILWNGEDLDKIQTTHLRARLVRFYRMGRWLVGRSVGL